MPCNVVSIKNRTKYDKNKTLPDMSCMKNGLIYLIRIE